MPVLLESKSITAEFNNAENGNLLFDRSEITFNRSYGDAICSADIRSVHLPLSKGLIFGMTKKDFQLMINFIPSAGTSEDHNEQYEYVQTEAEHTYTIRFGFVKNKLIRFFYEKDPCVIYD